MCVCGLVMFRNTIIVLLEPGTTGIEKHVINYVHSENVYSMFSEAINSNKGKTDILKTIKRCV